MATAKKPAAIAGEGAQALKHEDKRVNIPTADALDLVTEEVEEIKTVSYPRVPWQPAEQRDRALDPQLVWTGKDEADRTDLAVAAPAIFRQERIEPQYLVNQLIAESRRRKIAALDEEEDALFSVGEHFQDGIPDEFDKVDWYHHQMSWANRMILGDSLQVMASLAEREDLRGKVQMIYIDPPYGIKFNSNWQVKADSRDVKDGNLKSASREVEQIKAFRDTWELGINTYLSYLRDRLLAARELLRTSGSVFVQISDENIHLVRSLLDEVYGSDNFISLITVKKTTTGTGDFLASVGDYVIWYAKDRLEMKKSGKYRPLFRLKAVGGDGAAAYTQIEEIDGSRRLATRGERDDPTLAPAGSRFFRPSPLTSDAVGREKGEGAASWFAVEHEGQTFRPSEKVRWKTNEAGMERLALAGRLVATGKTLNYLRYLDDFPAFPINNIWEDTQSGSGMDKIYVVQTNTKIIERCMLMCTSPGDLVVDPTCGSGTTAYVAEQWGRRWITIDTSRIAITLARHRLMGAKHPAYLLADSPEGKAREAELGWRLPDDSESQYDVRKEFVYERVSHIMLRDIANNPNVKPGMPRAEIDAEIQKNAEFETLFDRPYENKKALRVAGPFTVESLSPHRNVAFRTELPASERNAAESADNSSYVETIIDHVKKAGVQNGVRSERLEFESIELIAGRTLTAIGVRRQADADTPARIGIALGPEYGTVDPAFIKNAAREALATGNIDMLLILGFAFDPTAVEAVSEFKPSGRDFAEVVRERTVGRMPVMLVRMNADLAMGDELANTGSGNLFTVFGEPDIEITETPDGQLVVEIRGVDVYNPTTGDIRADSTDEIMLWCIDTDYDSEAFFVRHAYFAGTATGKPKGPDPYEKLKRALRAEVDEEAWSARYQTVSQPFPKPASGKIAVKVVDYYGDEVLKVISDF